MYPFRVVRVVASAVFFFKSYHLSSDPSSKVDVLEEGRRRTMGAVERDGEFNTTSCPCFVCGFWKNVRDGCY